MTTVNPDLIAVLRVAFEISERGAGLSMNEALRRARYDERRPKIGVDQLSSVIEADPELAELWLAYSENKRTSGGWFILRSGEIGTVDDPGSRRSFPSMSDAVAEYVLRELDCCAGIRRAGERSDGPSGR